MKKRIERKNYLGPFVGLFVIISILLTLMSLGISHIQRMKYTNALNHERSYSEAEFKIKNFENLYEHYTKVLFAISSNRLFIDYLQNKTDTNNAYSAENLFSALINQDKTIMQLRYIDKDGFEKIRFDRTGINSKVSMMSHEKLQNKKSSYYFQDTIKLQKDKTYASKIDLNIEYKQIEIPYKPVLRIATPIVLNGVNDGIVVVNIFMKNLLEELTKSELFYCYIYDQDDHIIYSNNEKYINWSTYLLVNKTLLNKKKLVQNHMILNKNKDETIYMALEFKEQTSFVEDIEEVVLFLFLFILPISLLSGYFLSRIPKTLFDNLEEQQKIMIQQSKFVAMGEMVESLAHQWRQPLNAIGILIQEVKLNYKMDTLDKDTMETLNKDIQQYLESMSLTIDNFRSFFKPQGKKETFDMLKCINDAVDIIKPKLDEHKITVHIVSQNNTKSTTPFTLNGYKNEITHSILCLLRNASESIEKANKQVKNINITLKKDNDMLSVTLQDNGCGINPKLLHKIFEPYFTTKENELQGSGLGLYIVKNIIEGSMQGKVEVSNEKNGSKFELFIPIH